MCTSSLSLAATAQQHTHSTQLFLVNFVPLAIVQTETQQDYSIVAEKQGHLIWSWLS